LGGTPSSRRYDFLHNRGDLVTAFTEVESTRKHDRPQLAAALDACRKHKAVLLIAKLDRLARNVFFISGLMESGVEFIAMDMPEANRLTIHILAAVAEHEREMISQRTKAALQVAKARGTRVRVGGRIDEEHRVSLVLVLAERGGYAHRAVPRG
jgi:DNA invertase Pin-like site-specific DNA recombinase